MYVIYVYIYDISHVYIYTHTFYVCILYINIISILYIYIYTDMFMTAIMNMACDGSTTCPGSGSSATISRQSRRIWTRNDEDSWTIRVEKLKH